MAGEADKSKLASLAGHGFNGLRLLKWAGTRSDQGGGQFEQEQTSNFIKISVTW